MSFHQKEKKLNPPPQMIRHLDDAINHLVEKEA